MFHCHNEDRDEKLKRIVDNKDRVVTLFIVILLIIAILAIAVVSMQNDLNPKLLDFLVNSLGAILVVFFLGYKYFYIELKDPDQKEYYVGLMTREDGTYSTLVQSIPGVSLADSDKSISRFDTDSIDAFVVFKKFFPAYLKELDQAQDKNPYNLDAIEFKVLQWLRHLDQNMSFKKLMDINGVQSSAGSSILVAPNSSFKDVEIPFEKGDSLLHIIKTKITIWDDSVILRERNKQSRKLTITSPYSTIVIEIGNRYSMESLQNPNHTQLGAKILWGYSNNQHVSMNYYSVTFKMVQKPHLRLSNRSELEVIWFNNIKQNFEAYFHWPIVKNYI